MTGVVATVLVNSEVTKAQSHAIGCQGSKWKPAGTFQLPRAPLWWAILGLLHGCSFSTPHSSVLPLLDSSLHPYCSTLTLCSQAFWLLLRAPTLTTPSLQTWVSHSYGVSPPRCKRGSYNSANPKAILLVLLSPPTNTLFPCFLSLTWWHPPHCPNHTLRRHPGPLAPLLTHMLSVTVSLFNLPIFSHLPSMIGPLLFLGLSSISLPQFRSHPDVSPLSEMQIWFWMLLHKLTSIAPHLAVKARTP